MQSNACGLAAVLRPLTGILALDCGFDAMNAGCSRDGIDAGLTARMCKPYAYTPAHDFNRRHDLQSAPLVDSNVLLPEPKGCSPAWAAAKPHPRGGSTAPVASRQHPHAKAPHTASRSPHTPDAQPSCAASKRAKGRRRHRPQAMRRRPRTAYHVAFNQIMNGLISSSRSSHASS